METEVLAARFAEGADLLAQEIVLGAEAFVLLGELPACVNEREVVPEFHERRAQLYKNHAQLSRECVRLAQKNNPAQH